MQIDITTHSLLGAVTEVVQERGEHFVYVSACWYVQNEEPSCLFGRALHKLGVSIDTLYDGDCGGWSLRLFLANEGLPPRDADAFSVAQFNQDHEMPYGEVLTKLVAQLKLSE